MTGISPKEKILVVDDESNIRKILETRLTIRGYNVISASDGEEAIRLFHQEQPNLVILDIKLSITLYFSLSLQNGPIVGL